MKKLSAIVAALLMLQCIQAQIKEGIVTYEQKIDMYRRIPAENTQLRSMMPQFRTVKFELQFADSETLFKAVEEEPDLTEQHNNGVVMRFGGAENEAYRNFSKKIAIDKKDLMEDSYLVEDSIHTLNWKLEDGETKTILGYTCKKATTKTERGTDVIAWYSEEIPLASGPDQFNGLPGMILGIDANKSEITFTAININKKIDLKKLKAPTTGKKVTAVEFAKKQKDLLGNSPGGVRIVTN